MKILLNNREEEFDTEVMSVSDMLKLKKFSFRMRIIHNGDNIQMLYLMSGG
jgi:sulfur carrier protein ThiS